MKSIIAWLKTSNHWKHVVGGAVIGAGANGWYCALYAGCGVAAAMELKDCLWGGEWGWTDLTLTVAGVVAGHLLRVAVLAVL